MLETTHPELVIEVGTWKGASAIHMGKLIREKNWSTKIVCVDTWLGDTDFWLSPTKKLSLKLTRGHPAIYDQFIFNVIQSGLTDLIIPFPQTASNAARWFQHHRIQADLIYLDAGHQEADVYSDLSHYYPLLRAGGIIFGDDYFPGSEGVVQAVNRFVSEIKEDFEIHEDQFWSIRKTLSR
ncbi:MAG TPA: class I SAM-dependent methyltransferase [Candidatus Omnitrophota bacterium]|nr:class I SAM-dependent methyltransferase [Candidatus Omnitrophota bacterium]